MKKMQACTYCSKGRPPPPTFGFCRNMLIYNVLNKNFGQMWSQLLVWNTKLRACSVLIMENRLTKQMQINHCRRILMIFTRWAWSQVREGGGVNIPPPSSRYQLNDDLFFFMFIAFSLCKSNIQWNSIQAKKEYVLYVNKITHVFIES